jgi:hypothetical protein
LSALRRINVISFSCKSQWAILATLTERPRTARDTFCTAVVGRPTRWTINAFGGSVFVLGIGVFFAKLARRRTFDIVVFSFDAGNARRLFGQRLGIPKWALHARVHV